MTGDENNQMPPYLKAILKRTKDPSYCIGAVKDIEYLVSRLLRTEQQLHEMQTRDENGSIRGAMREPVV